ncbi:MAG: cysteine hydrolase [Dehalococcoidales bacterium]|nr:MAG: cysteine hydrolase [Dehalococcoidales bacterium]
MANTVLVVDMLRGFLEEGYPLYIGDECRGIIPNIQELLGKETNNGSSVIYICDHHTPDDLEFKMFPPHCIEGTPETEIIHELSGYKGEIIPKRRYSGFFDTPLEDRLKDLRPDKLIICGVLTNICVLHTAADARNRDYEVEIPVNCVASPDADAHQFALDHMEKVLGVTLRNR